MDTQRLSDKDLVTRILSGHPDLFGPLVERHIRAAHAIAYARLGNTADAEDAVQEAFLRAYERLATLRDPAKFAAWLLTITRHEAGRVAAKRHRADSLRPAPDDPHPRDFSGLSGSSDLSAHHSIHADHEQHEMNSMLRDHLLRLPEPAREVLLLHYFAGHSARDIAELLDLRRAAVLKRLQRAREQLAETLLGDLQASRPSESALAKQAARITLLASTATIPFAVSGSTAIAAGARVASKFRSSRTALFLAASALIAMVAIQWMSTNSPPAARPQRQSSGSIAQVRGVEPLESQADETSGPPPIAAMGQVEPASFIETGEERSGRPENDWSSWLKLPITKAVANQHIAVVLKQITEQFGGMIFLIDTRAIGIPAPSSENEVSPGQGDRYPVSGMLSRVDIQGLPIPTALTLICNELGLEVSQEASYLWISTPKQLQQDFLDNIRGPIPGRTIYLDGVNNSVTLNFESVHIADVLESIQDQNGKFPNVVLDSRVVAPAYGPSTQAVLPPGKITDGMIREIVLRDVPAMDYLAALCNLTSTVSAIRSDYIWVTSPASAATSGMRLSPNRVGIEKKLSKPVEYAFTTTPLNEAVQHMTLGTQANIILDQRVVAWPEEPKSAMPLPGSPGLPVDTISHGMIYGFQTVAITLKSFLEILMDSLDLNYEIRDDHFVVTSKSALDQGPLTDPHLFTPDQFIAALPATVEPPNQRGLLRLIRIERADSGEYSVEFKRGVFTSIYTEGDRMEDYTLQHIDADAGCVSLFDDRTNEAFDLCLEKKGSQIGDRK